MSPRVAFMTFACPTPDQPLLGQYNARLARAMIDSGHPTQLVHCGPWMPSLLASLHPTIRRLSARPRQWSTLGVDVTSLRAPMPQPMWAYWSLNPRSPALTAFMFRVGLGSQALHALRDFRAEAILAHNGILLGPLAAWLSRTLNIPYAVIEHDAVDWDPASTVGRAYAAQLASARCVFGVGLPTIWHLREELGLRNVRFAPNGVVGATPEQLAAPRPQDLAGKLIVLCVGSATPTKGQFDLLTAFEAVAPPEAILICIGGLTPPAQDVAARLGDRVRSLGHLAHEQVQQWMAWADLFALPSRLESFGLVYAEALAAGTPVILTSAAGIAPLLTHGQHGWIVPVGDQAALNAALREALTSADLKAMGRHGRELVVGRFTWQRTAEAIIAGLENRPEPEWLVVGPRPAHIPKAVGGGRYRGAKV
jgi:glycosyltransferase involved in cell wall biosynthesis